MGQQDLAIGIQQGKKRTHTVDIDLSHIDPTYVGTFKFHHPSLMEQKNIGVIKAGLLNGLPQGSVDIVADNIAHMSATLEVVLDSYPQWFILDINQIYDYEILETVYDEYAEWYESFRKSSRKNDNQEDSPTP